MASGSVTATEAAHTAAMTIRQPRDVRRERSGCTIAKYRSTAMAIDVSVDTYTLTPIIIGTT